MNMSTAGIRFTHHIEGQVTIPIGIREKAGLLPNTEVDFVFERGVVRLVKV